MDSAKAGGERAVVAPRRATRDPRRFLVPASSLPPGFADLVESGEFEPVTSRPASTVVIAREGDGMQILLLRRPMRSGFAAGAWVFPGGRVDVADSDPALGAHVSGPGASEWAQRLSLEGQPGEALGYVIAALREAWEETGILIGTASAPPGELNRLREQLLADAATMPEIARRGGIRFDTTHLLYIAHWITPAPEPRRYDTRFFLAHAPAGAECRLLGEELSEARWFAPADAVRRYENDELRLLPPTVDTLRRLAAFDTLEEAWAALRQEPVTSIEPRMSRVADGVMIEF